MNQLQAAGGTGASVTGVNGLTIQAGTGITGTLAVGVAVDAAKVTVQGGQASTINVTNVGTNGVEVYAQKAGTTAAPIAISVDGVGATDAAKVSASGNANLTVGATNAIETLTLQGNGAAATFALTAANAPTTYKFDGSQSVTVSGDVKAFAGKTVTDETTAGTTTVKFTANAAVAATTADLTKIAADVIDIGYDAGTLAFTTVAAGKLNVSVGQTSLTATAAAATAATNSLALTVDNGTTGIQTVALGNVAITNFKNVSITANENTSAGGSFGATTAVTASGAGTLGFTATALSLDASAMTGAVTATASTNLKTIKTGSANDTINLTTAVDVTLDGGAGAGDTLALDGATLDLSGNAINLSNMEIIKLDSTTTSADNVTLAGSVLSSKNYVVTSGFDNGAGVANDVLTVKMDSTNVDLSKLTVDTTKVTVAIDASTVNGAALTITGSNANDTATGGGLADTIIAGAGNDSINGAGGNDTLKGEAGADTIVGGAGNDTIVAGEGADKVWGGAGADIIDLVETTSAADVVLIQALTDGSAAGVATGTFTGFDVITGFKSGTDKVLFDSAATPTYATGGTPIALTAAVKAGDVATVAANKLTAADFANVDKVVLFLNDAGVAFTGGAAASTDIVAVTVGTTTAMYTVTNDGTAGVLAAEVKLIGTVDAAMVVGDFIIA